MIFNEVGIKVTRDVEYMPFLENHVYSASFKELIHYVLGYPYSV